MQQALNLHRAGDMRGAAQAYEQILQQHPNTAEAWHMLRVLTHQLGKNDLAATCIERAIKLDPAQAAYHSNLGVVYRTQGKLREAVAQYRLAILRMPDYPEAYNNLGQSLHELKELTDAETQLREALRLRSEYAEARFNLAHVLQSQGRFDEATVEYRKAVRIAPNYADAWNNLGVTLKNLSQFDKAREALETALQHNPQLTEAWYNLAQTWHVQGRLVEAIDCYDRFLTERPDYAAGHNNLGNAFEDLGEVDRAIACYERALDLRPEMVEALNNLGHAYQVQGRLVEAEESYREALSLQPNNAQVLSNLLFFLNYTPRISQEQLLVEHRRWNELHAAKAQRCVLANGRDPARRLRIGYVSPDVRSHPVGNFLEPILAYHDATQFEVTVYADVAVPDLVTMQLEKLAHRWRNTRWVSHDRLAEMVQADEIDILIDLAGHTALGRLSAFARKPAPVQATYLGYPNTTGLDAIDYRLTDAVADPPEEPNLHSETLVHLEPVFACYAPPTTAPEPNSLPARVNGFVTFGSLHTLSKLNDSVLDTWARLLKTVVNSRLLIARDTFNGSARERIVAEFKRREIGADRLVLDREMHCGDPHLALYHTIDIALDVFPWSGHTTACEALWMGVPVITLQGNRHAGRMVASTLHGLGHREWIARTMPDYVNIARDLSRDWERLDELRRSLRETLRQSEVCNGAVFTRHLEAAYRKMWTTWCESSISSDGRN